MRRTGGERTQDYLFRSDRSNTPGIARLAPVLADYGAWYTRHRAAAGIRLFMPDDGSQLLLQLAMVPSLIAPANATSEVAEPRRISENQRLRVSQNRVHPLPLGR